MNVASWIQFHPVLALRWPSLPAIELAVALLCLVGLVGWLAIRQPAWILYGLVFLELTHLDFLLPETRPISVSLALEGILAAGLMIHWIATGASLRVAWPQTVLLNVYVLMACLSSFLVAPSTVDLNGRLVIKDLLVRWFTIMAITQLVATDQDREKAYGLLLISAAVLVGLSLGKLALTGTNWRSRELPPWVTGPILLRANAPGVHTDNLACELVMMFPLLFSYLASPGKSGLKVLSALLTPLFFLNIILTYSRTGFLVLGVAVLGTLFYRRGWGKALVVVVVALAVGLLAPQAFWQRMATIVTDREGSSRIFLYAAAIRMIKASPLWGVGYGGFQHLVNQYYPLPTGTVSGSPHNIYLDVWAETGILALLVFLALLATSIAALHRLRRELVSLSALESRLFALELALLIFALAGLTTPLLLDPVFHVILGLALSAIAARRLRETKLEARAETCPHREIEPRSYVSRPGIDS
ncbi:MAG: O-antigen ligase family protein [candidate division KSB1 bacterium]|nr:O-antigen ligase family protein [candidate division KSB1 bacterium]